MQAGLDRVRVDPQQLEHHHAHGVDVADGRAGAFPLRGRLSSSQPSSAVRQPQTHASGGRSSRRHVRVALSAQLRSLRTGVAQRSARILDRLQRARGSRAQGQSLQLITSQLCKIK